MALGAAGSLELDRAAGLLASQASEGRGLGEILSAAPGLSPEVGAYLSLAERTGEGKAAKDRKDGKDRKEKKAGVQHGHATRFRLKEAGLALEEWVGFYADDQVQVTGGSAGLAGLALPGDSHAQPVGRASGNLGPVGSK